MPKATKKTKPFKLFTLKPGGDDTRCSHCGEMVSVNWTVEPVLGDHGGTCPGCGKEMTFEAFVAYSWPDVTGED